MKEVQSTGLVDRTAVRSFDHRSVACLLQLEPALAGAVLVADAAPVDPAGLARALGVATYCPAYPFVDEELVKRVHHAGVRIVPWTVNEPIHWRRLLDWGVDGITTDYPDQLAADLDKRGLDH